MVEPEDAVPLLPLLTTPEDALAILQAAQAGIDAGLHDIARTQLESVAASGFYGEWAYFFLGRSHRNQSQHAEAIRAFDSAIERSSGLFWAHYERLTLIAESGLRTQRLGAFATSMLGLAWEPLQASHVSALEDVAHLLWDTGDVATGTALLLKLWPADGMTTLSLARIVEADIDAETTTAASQRLAALTEAEPEVQTPDAQPLDEADEEPDSASDPIDPATILEIRRASAPKDFPTWLELVRTLAKTGDAARTAAAIASGTDFTRRQQSFVSLIGHLELGKTDTAFLDFRNHARLYGEIPKFPGIRLAYMLGDMFDVARRNEVLALLLSTYDGDQDVALVQINAAIRDQRWDDANHLFETHFANIPDPPQSVRLTRIDILAFSGRLQEAAALLDAERIDGVCPPAFMRSALRVLGELERWDDVFAIGLPGLGDDTSFEQFLTLMIRAARKTNQQEDLLAGLLALPRPLARTQHDALYAVMEDMAELGHADVIDRIGDLPLPYEREHRIRLKLRAAAGKDAAPIAKDLCIYYCADRNYLVPALVSLTALAMSNVSILRRAVFHIVVDHDVVDLAREAGGAIARRLGLTLEVTDASTIVTSADRLRTSYGIFTGGQQLALAAYYRIFFARWLVDQNRYSQALYVDADTIVRSGLDEVFVHEHTTPLMARPETDRPEVRHATAIHALAGRYFNSGVLLFDLSHPDLPRLLDRAIAAAIDPDVTLIFQDQCALNIAFDTQAAALPERFNYFNPPSVSGDAIAATDAVIVHFLDRPKPWDSMYQRRAREWFEWYDLVETLRMDMAQA